MLEHAASELCSHDLLPSYLIHSPFFADGGKDEATLQKAWKAMEDVQASGKAKSIGVSNFLPQHFDAIMKTAKVTPAMNQIEVRFRSR